VKACCRSRLLPILAAWALFATPLAWGQAPPEAEGQALTAKLAELQKAVAALKAADVDPLLLADVEVYAKAVDWGLRHNEFYTPDYARQGLAGLETGLARAAELTQGEASWDQRPGRKIRGYYSAVEGSVQPYAVGLPADFDAAQERRWPVHVVLHGRGDKLNEISFINAHDNKPAAAQQTWIQLDIFGRTNNGYRWSGETDLFEALAAVKRRYRVDNKRIVLHGFSMGGAGSWHLGLHYPSLWCAVGPGAGFVDFYKYQNVSDKLPAYQDDALKIYDSIDYALNAFDVPVCTYGGELDAQLAASTNMVEAAKQLDVPIKMIIGPGVGHKFHPDSQKEFLAFLNGEMMKGRKVYPGMKELKFITYTPKYNTCEWLTVEELIEPYRPAIVQGHVDDQSVLHLKTQNVAVLQIARDVAEDIEIDGNTLPLTTAAQGLLPGVYFSRGDEWGALSYESSLGFNKNLDSRKRRNLQGPIDDAFMQPFVCVRGTGRPWSAEQAAWANWTLERFEREFDKWFRARIEIIDDTAVTDEMLSRKNLILFGDPGSNSVLAKIAKQLPVKWGEKSFSINGQEYDPATHGLSLIYPNPIVPHRYIVINSGHTFHDKEFRASNAQLYPRLGDIAVQKFEKAADGGYTESVVWADIFNSSWRLRENQKNAAAPKRAE
jgi:hypothetical protein